MADPRIERIKRDKRKAPWQGPPMPGSFGELSPDDPSLADYGRKALSWLMGDDRSSYQMADKLVGMTGLTATDATKKFEQGDYLGGGIDLMSAVPDVGPAAKTVAAAFIPGAKTMWHGLSKTKLSRPLEEMTATYNDIPGALIDRKIIDPQSLQGSKLIPAIGDRTIAGKQLTGVNETPFAKPVDLMGGPNFMRGPQQQAEGAAWASEKGRISSLARRVREAGAGGNDVNMVYSPMSPVAGDYADMMARAMMEQMPAAKVKRADLKLFDEEMSGQVADFPGLKKIDDQWLANAGGDRTKLVKTMALGKHQNAGFPDIGSTRNAITEPEVRDLTTGEAGFNVAKMDPEGRVITDPKLPHTTYNTQLGGQYAGSFERPIPRSIMFRDWMKTRPRNEPGPMNDYAFERQNVLQDADQQWLDGIMKYLESFR